MNKILKSMILIITLFVILVCVSKAVANGSNQIMGDLRVDLPEIYNSGDYRVKIRASALPQTGDLLHDTSGWLAINLGTPPNLFTQVGIITTPEGPHWFVENDDAIVTCDKGSPIFNGHGCIGNPYEIVSIGSFHYFELVKYPWNNYWIARVYTASDYPYDVAKFWNGSSVISRSLVAMEEAYEGDNDPFILGMFIFNNPEYMVWGPGFTSWPQSIFGGQRNYIWASDLNYNNFFCPGEYAMIPNYDNDSKKWFAGSIGTECDWTLFPPVSSYGTYDDFSTSLIEFLPAGNWTQYNNIPNAMWNTITRSMTYEDKVRFTFNGNSISYFYSTGVDRGTQNIYLDGNSLDNLNSQIPYGYRRQIGKTWSVSGGDHSIEVINGGNYIDMDAFAVDIATVGPSIYPYDDTHTQLRYFGNWVAQSGIKGAYNNTEHFANSSGALMRFTFTGNSITYCYSKANNRAIVGVTIDGITYPDLDLYNPTVQRHVCSTYSGLDNSNGGIHIFNIMDTGRKNSNSTDYFISVDDLVVQ